MSATTFFTDPIDPATVAGVVHRSALVDNPQPDGYLVVLTDGRQVVVDEARGRALLSA